MKKGKSLIIFLFLVSLFLSCANTRVSVNPDLLAADNITSSTDKPSEQQYYLQLGDVIDVKFYYDSKLNETVTIRPDGKISLQLIGELTAAGLTPSDLNKTIINKYTKFLKDPEIIVIVKEFGGQRVYVGGEVLAPGVIPLKGNMTALQAILNAGGFKETAHRGSIIIISRGSEDTSVTRKIDLRDIVSGKANGKDVFVKPFDVIYVPKTFIAEVDKFVEQYITKVIPGTLTGGFSYGVFKTRPPVP
jgi:polysaccharide export outer membrane protein